LIENIEEFNKKLKTNPNNKILKNDHS